MSYILDALRKADAQRASDPARGIHAQPAAVAVVSSTGSRRRASMVWATVALLIVIAAAWLWSSPAPLAALPAAPAPVAAPVVRVEPVAAAQAALPATEVLPPPPQAAVLAAAKPPPVAAVPMAAQTPAPVAVRAAAADRTYSLAELPADVQQALPKFSVSGGVYSENVAQRMLVVNGQVFNEGSEIATGVVLEQIRPRVALLKFRGLRISQPY